MYRPSSNIPRTWLILIIYYLVILKSIVEMQDMSRKKISDRSQHNTWIFGPCQIFDDTCGSHARMEQLELISNMIFLKVHSKFSQDASILKTTPFKTTESIAILCPQRPVEMSCLIAWAPFPISQASENGQVSATYQCNIKSSVTTCTQIACSKSYTHIIL